jgi:dTMP kinase
MNSKYFVIEANDGVGKTTTLKALSTELQKDGFNFIVTKEPGGSKALKQEWSSLNHPYGFEYEGFRDLCVNHPEIPNLVKRALYKADSLYNWISVIKPALETGIVVLSDRSWISDLAYGAALADLTQADLFNFNMALVPEQAKITNVIYLTCPEEVRETRLAANIADAADKIGIEARRRIENEYKLCLNNYVANYVIIDTNQPIENVVNLCKKFVYKNCNK